LVKFFSPTEGLLIRLFSTVHQMEGKVYQMTVATEKVLQVTAGWKNVQNQDVQNVFHFRTSFNTPQTEAAIFTGLQTILDNLFGAFELYIDIGATPDLMKVDVVEWDGVDKWAVTQNVAYEPWGAGITPGGAGAVLPGGVALLGTLFTNIGKHASRKFFGMITEDGATNDGLFKSITVSSVATGLEELLTAYVISSGNELSGVILDRATGVIRDIIEVAATAIPAYQRRRRTGTGS